MHIVDERRYLQIAIALAAIVPIAAGIMGVVKGEALFDLPYKLNADSHIRYLSGLLLGLGLWLWALIPRIEERSTQFVLMCSLIILGGLARMWGLFIHQELPSTIVQFALLMELVVTPGLAFWQNRIAALFLAKQALTREA